MPRILSDQQKVLGRCGSLDLEINPAGQVYEIGAVFNDQSFTRKNCARAVRAALRDLDAFLDPADFLLGHNLLGHDRPALQLMAPDLRLLDKPVIDTLFLSPLAFPENPYHRRGVLTIVISPLQALMKDQVDNLRNRTGTPSAAALYGMLTPPQRGEVLNNIRMGDVGILYISPEQLRNRSFRAAIRQREIGCWVFDEAHCLSKWGHDFRTDYLYAARFISEFARTQKMDIPAIQCFTATAKTDVKEEILKIFQEKPGRELRVFASGVERNNLHFEVQEISGSGKYSRIHELLSERLPEDGSAIVYCATRKATEQLAEALVHRGWEAAAFHAGLTPPAKQHIQENFLQGTIRIICATNAFGMGIDKENVRLVINADKDQSFSADQLAELLPPLCLVDGHLPVAALSQKSADHWKTRLTAIETIRVLAMIQRTVDDSAPEFRTRYHTERWEVPMVDIIHAPI